MEQIRKILSSWSCVQMPEHQRYIPSPESEEIDAALEDFCGLTELTDARPSFIQEYKDTEDDITKNHHIMTLFKENKLDAEQIEKINALSKFMNLCKAISHIMEKHDYDSNCNCLQKINCKCYLCNINGFDEVNFFNRKHETRFNDIEYGLLKKFREKHKIDTQMALIYLNHCHACGTETEKENYGNIYCSDQCETDAVHRHTLKCCFKHTINASFKCEVCYKK